MKCISCDTEFREGVSFRCPSCGKKIISRCIKCKKLVASYECECGFKGP